MIYRLVLLHIFGRGSWWKLSALYIAAFILGLFLAGGVGQLAVSYVIPEWRIGVTVFIAVQAAVQIVLFAASGTLRSYGTFEQILVHLPVAPRIRWLALMLPSATLSSLTVILICLPLGVTASNMGLSTGLFLIVLTLGWIVGFCGYWAMRQRRLVVQQAMALLLILLEYKSMSFIAVSERYLQVLVMIAWTLVLLAVLGLFMASRSALIRDVTKKSQARAVQWTGLTSLWFCKKVWRSQSLMINFAMTIIIFSGIALLCLKHPEYAVFTAIVSGLLGATMVADIRSAARKSSPPEIPGIKGTAYFLLNHLSAASMLAVTAALPLLLFAPTESSVYVQLCIGICAGFFAGTLLVPASKDIAAQCVATLLCTCLLVIPSHLVSIGKLTPFIHSLGQVVIALLLLLASAGIEYKRNNYRWRHHAI